MNIRAFIEEVQGLARGGQVGCAMAGTYKAELRVGSDIGPMPDSSGSFEWIQNTVGTIRSARMPTALLDRMTEKAIRDWDGPIGLPVWRDRVSLESGLLCDVDGYEYAISVIQSEKVGHVVLLSLLKNP